MYVCMYVCMYQSARSAPFSLEGEGLGMRVNDAQKEQITTKSSQLNFYNFQQ